MKGIKIILFFYIFIFIFLFFNNGCIFILAKTDEPIFNPKGWTYYNPITITIECATSGATIRYTTDGSTPTISHGIIYTNPITLDENTILKAIAYIANFNAVSDVAYATYIFDF